MSEQVQGVVQEINTKTVQIKRGPKAGNDSTVYSMTLDTGHKINLGFKCTYAQGESVNLTLEPTNFGDYKIISSGGAVPAPVQQAAAKHTNMTMAAPTREFPIAKDSRGMSITRQNSGGHAAVMVAALIEQGTINTPEGAIDTFMDFVYEITDFATGHREEAQAAAMQVLED